MFVMITTNVPMILVALSTVAYTNLKSVTIRIIEPRTSVINPLDVISLLFLAMMKTLVRMMTSTWQEIVYVPQ